MKSTAVQTDYGNKGAIKGENMEKEKIYILKTENITALGIDADYKFFKTKKNAEQELKQTIRTAIESWQKRNKNNPNTNQLKYFNANKYFEAYEEYYENEKAFFTLEGILDAPDDICCSIIEKEIADEVINKAEILEQNFTKLLDLQMQHQSQMNNISRAIIAMKHKILKKETEILKEYITETDLLKEMAKSILDLIEKEKSDKEEIWAVLTESNGDTNPTIQIFHDPENAKQYLEKEFYTELTDDTELTDKQKIDIMNKFTTENNRTEYHIPKRYSDSYGIIKKHVLKP